MTTNFTYKNFDVYALEASKGKFPHKYWESESIPVYGCPEVTAYLQIYPTGVADGKGHVSAYVCFKSTNPTISMELTVSISIHGTEQFEQKADITVGDNSLVKFGRGWGWPKMCKIQNIYEEPKTTLQFRVSVWKYTEKKGTEGFLLDVTTRPTGEQDFVGTNDVHALTKSQ
eukprot:Phypoly_transcript_19762.p1 GENE.Phypoly_transcript_19762~~Phypoly_transcript_19762.p1  ORF type:complete len:172 (+),score=23.47 Phypoly_transcript_19762:188-703(+)